MAQAIAYPAALEFHGEGHVARWRPLVQWLLAIPHLMVIYVLGMLRNVLILISFFAVLFTKQMPRALFDLIAMTLRYEWRVTSYALFLHEDYPPFDFAMSGDDDGADPNSAVTIRYPEELGRWQPLYKWLIAIPHYVVLFVLCVGAVFAVIAGFFAVIFTGEYPAGLRNYLVGVSRYSLRVQSYIGLLTDQYPPFALS